MGQHESSFLEGKKRVDAKGCSDDESSRREQPRSGVSEAADGAEAEGYLDPEQYYPRAEAGDEGPGRGLRVEEGVDNGQVCIFLVLGPPLQM